MATVGKVFRKAAIVGFVLGFLSIALAQARVTSEPRPPKSCDELLTRINAFFLQGEGDLVLKEIDDFFRSNGRILYYYDTTCQVTVYRMYALVNYQIRRDFVASYLYYRNLFIVKPDAELWDLGLIYPILAQSYFDSLKQYWVPRRNPEVYGDSAIWNNQWTPGIKMEVAKGASELKRRVTLRDRKATLYHRARWLYAQSGAVREFEDLYYLIHSESDPVFSLLKADIRLRLGYGPSDVNRELTRYKSKSSLVDGQEMADWYRRIQSRCLRLEELAYIPRIKQSRIDSIGVIDFKVDRRYLR
jgi:hypothetical protein